MKSLTYSEAVVELVETEVLTISVACGIGITAAGFSKFLMLPTNKQQEAVQLMLAKLHDEPSWMQGAGGSKV